MSKACMDFDGRIERVNEWLREAGNGDVADLIRDLRAELAGVTAECQQRRDAVESPEVAEADALDRLRQEVHEAHARLDDSVPTEMGGKVLTLVERIAELEQTADDALVRYEATEAALAQGNADMAAAAIQVTRGRTRAEAAERRAALAAQTVADAIQKLQRYCEDDVVRRPSTTEYLDAEQVEEALAGLLAKKWVVGADHVAE